MSSRALSAVEWVEGYSPELAEGNPFLLLTHVILNPFPVCHPDQAKRVEGSLSRSLSLMLFFLGNFTYAYAMRHYFVYILASNTGTLYIGVTHCLQRRVNQHGLELVEGFTKTYHCHKLIYFEDYSDITQAIAREKQLKGWVRKKKIALITKTNPGWRDLLLDLEEEIV